MTCAAAHAILLNSQQFFAQLQHLFTAGKGFDVHYNQIAFPVLGQVDRLSRFFAQLGDLVIVLPDHPLALRIRKIHAVTKDPLPGAEFQLKADGNLTKALSFTEKGGVFWYDPNGSITTLTLNSDCEALLYGLPVGKYNLEETKVPDGYFPIAPVACTLTVENTTQAPLDVTISNAPAVKLGLDTDRYNAVIAVGTAAALLAILGFAWLHQKRRSRD